MYPEITLPPGPRLEVATKTDLDAYNGWFDDRLLSRPGQLQAFVQSSPGFADWNGDFSAASLGPLEAWVSHKIAPAPAPDCRNTSPPCANPLI